MLHFYRKRFLNFLADFDLMDLSHTKLFEVLSKNLRTSECMVYVYQLNADNSNDEIQFICGSQDLLQWQARDPRLQAGQIKNIIKAFPIAEKDKLLVLSYVNKLQTPILKDQTIFILTFLVGKWEQSTLLSFHIKYLVLFLSQTSRDLLIAIPPYYMCIYWSVVSKT